MNPRWNSPEIFVVAFRSKVCNFNCLKTWYLTIETLAIIIESYSK